MVPPAAGAPVLSGDGPIKYSAVNSCIRMAEAGDEMADIKRLFTPEFRNRLDATVSFKALDETVTRCRPSLRARLS